MIRILSLFCLILGTVSVQAEETSPSKRVLGLWLTSDAGARVEIYAKNGKIHGKIVWLEDTVYEAGDPEAGKPVHDRNNPDESKRNDPIIGLNLIQNFAYEADSETWKKGTIYDPKNGKTYKCRLTMTSEKVLEVRGYLGSPVFGRTEVWKRYVPEKKAAEKVPTE